MPMVYYVGKGYGIDNFYLYHRMQFQIPLCCRLKEKSVVVLYPVISIKDNQIHDMHC